MSDRRGYNPEQAINFELGKALRGLHPRWSENAVFVEQTGLISDNPSQRVDILFNHPTGIPVAIETEFSPARTVEKDAQSRLGKLFALNSNMIEQAIALRIPNEYKSLPQEKLSGSISDATFEYCLLSCSGRDILPESVRWPELGWISGTIQDLATFIEYTSLSENRIAEGMTILEEGIDRSSKYLRYSIEKGDNTLIDIARCLRQEDNEQTTRMAMAIVANAVAFHSLIAGKNDTQSLSKLKVEGTHILNRIDGEGAKIRDSINYWPIFDIALQIISTIRPKFVARIMDLLSEAVGKLESLGATSQHDLSGRMFQRLITDRKFLATYYTLPSSATLLAELAIPRLSTDWSDKKSVTALRIADFACGTGALLNASYAATLSRYRRAKSGADDAKIHAEMIEKVLVGTDIMPAATHLTTSILSSAHPMETFQNTQIVTLKYGEADNGTGNDVYIGALELIEQEDTLPEFRIQQEHLHGGEGNIEKPVDLPHESFDLVIMNPPFTRPTGHESDKIGIPVPSFAGFGTKDQEQRRMSKKLSNIKRQIKAGNGLAGLASNFIDLADAKVKRGGVVALVLPSTFASGEAWSYARNLFEQNYIDILVVSIGSTKSNEMTFSADTGMAEVLVVATRKTSTSTKKYPVTFVNLLKRPSSLLEAFNIAKVIRERSKDNSGDCQELYLDVTRKNVVGHLVRTKSGFYDKLGLPRVIRVRDIDISRVALRFSQGHLQLPRQSKKLNLPIVKLGELGSRGPYHQDINGPSAGLFNITDIVPGTTPTHPVLWAHNVNSGRESRMVVTPDKQANPREGKNSQAGHFWSKHSSRLCFNRDFRLNSQPLSACIASTPVLGGVAWPSFRCDESQYDIPIVLWMNTTLGLFSHWYTGTRQQSGRSRLSILLLSSLAIIDVRKLTKSQLEQSHKIFEDFSKVELLPANEAWRDEGRKALDRAVLVDLLNQRPQIMESLDLLRTKWCLEPSVHGGKRTQPDLD